MNPGENKLYALMLMLMLMVVVVVMVMVPVHTRPGTLVSNLAPSRMFPCAAIHGKARQN